MGCQNKCCPKCSEAATVTVEISFSPGGSELFCLCFDHAADMYETFTRWYAGDRRTTPSKRRKVASH